MRMVTRHPWAATLFAGSAVIAAPANAGGPQWSTTEVQLQLGQLDVPQFAGGGTDTTFIVTGQHASGWGFGDVFWFADVSKGDDSEDNHFNHWDLYSELYLNFSSAKILKVKYGDGVLRDIGLIAGVNYGMDPGVLKFLPGVRFAWNIPGFNFLNTDITAYIDASEGVDGGDFNAPEETDSFMVDMNFASKSFAIGKQHFNVEGHVEYIGKRRNEFGERVHAHILGQPQLRWDAGETMFGKPNKLFLGVEYQFWFNKLGEEDQDEHAVQALAVWRF